MEQYKALDISKFIAAFLIVGHHVDPVDSYALRCLYALAVPYFFMVSSFLFFRRKADFGKYARRIGVLYLVWFVIEAGVVYTRFFYGVPFVIGVSKFLHALLLTNTFWESWYLVASVEAMGLCVWLSRWCSNRVLLLLGMLLYLPALLFSGYYGNLSEEGRLAMSTLYSWVPVTNSFVIAFIYVVLGKMIAESQWTCSFWQTLRLFLFAVIMGGAEMYVQQPFVHGFKAFVMLPPIIAFLVLLLKDERMCALPVGGAMCKRLRSSSTLIYLSHPLFISLVARLTGLHHTPLVYVAVVLCSCVFAFFVIRASERWRFLRYLY